MPTEPELVGLLQRADWTNLSLAATVSRRFNRALRDELLRSMPLPPWAPSWVRVMQDPDDLPIALGEEVTGRLIVAPALRFREELTDESGETAIRGCDGDRVWLVSPRVSATETTAGDGPGAGVRRSYAGGSPEPPCRRLLSPAWLLSGFGLRIEGAVTAGSREAWRVVAVPEARRPTPLGPQRFNLIVDAELGILLRCEALVRGLPLWLEQLDAVRIQPPEAADDSLFAAPPDALPDARDLRGEFFPGGLGTAAGLAADALGFAIRHGPGGLRRPPADGEEPMPRDADDAGQEHWPAVSDETAYLLYSASSAGQNVAAELHEWVSVAGFAEGLRRGSRALGQGGIRRLADAITEKAAPRTTHRVARLRYAADGLRYRLDWVSGAPGRRPVTESCDGQTRWRVYPDRTVSGAARPAPSRVADLMQPSWLLGWRLADGGAGIVGGRPGHRVRATRIPGVTLTGPALAYDSAVAVIDTELGVITRLTCYAADEPTERRELRDVRVLAPTDAAEFRVRAAPDPQAAQQPGPFDAAPEPVRQVVRAAEQAGRIVGPVVSRAADFLNSLRSRGQQ
ncbi:MAG TPA: hypothetical protein VEH05_19370 [Streptosporangiaceae bacterium]|nr:hypothetical protein [Streptosporangiaceae bacterium]